jgi:bile acid-coenzyme A ligase
VTVALPNGIEFFEVAMAAWKLGVIVQPISASMPRRERESVIALANPALVIGVSAREHEDRVCIPVAFEPDATLSDAPIAPDRISPSWKALTSGGSTGTPKLIVSSANGEVDPLAAMRYESRENSVVLVPGPLYHNAPFTTAFTNLFFGNHVVIMPKFDPVMVLEAIQHYGVDLINVVPTMLLRMWRILERDPTSYDLSSLRVLWHMAAPCPEWLKEEWINLLGSDRVFELYAGTESQAATTIRGDEWLQHRGSVGRPLFGEMKVVDNDGCELPPGEVGEIFMRGPEGGMPSYRYVGAEARVRDGWESLGDLGWLDEDGYLYISDRRTDLILSGGANVYPAEVESALLEHPCVDSAVVVGLPDDDLGQRVHAVVQPIGDLTENDLISFLAERLVRYKLPRSFHFVDEPLRNDADKVRRSAIREREMKLSKNSSFR